MLTPQGLLFVEIPKWNFAAGAGPFRKHRCPSAAKASGDNRKLGKVAAFSVGLALPGKVSVSWTRMKPCSESKGRECHRGCGLTALLAAPFSEPSLGGGRVTTPSEPPELGLAVHRFLPGKKLLRTWLCRVPSDLWGGCHYFHYCRHEWFYTCRNGMLAGAREGPVSLP